jgi:hypothetical protein
MRLPRNNGSALEKTVIASQGGVIRIEQFRAGQRHVRGGRTVGQTVPCDFIGTIRGTGRSIWFDAKSCGDAASFNAAASHVKPHQRHSLCRQGECGAVAGLLCEATDAEWRCYFWLPWWQLATNDTVYPWADLIPLGPSTRTIHFERLIHLHDKATPERFRVKGAA